MQKLMITLAAVLGVFLIACGSTTPPDIGQLESAPASAAPAPTGPLTTFGDGTYEVGAGAGQVKPGKYKTTGTGLGCYWARLKGLSGDVEDIQANGNVKPGTPGIMTVAAKDKGIELKGGCTWTA